MPKPSFLAKRQYFALEKLLYLRLYYAIWAKNATFLIIFFIILWRKDIDMHYEQVVF